eukprot:2549052-Rhodomonas_salina.2
MGVAQGSCPRNRYQGSLSSGVASLLWAPPQPTPPSRLLSQLLSQLLPASACPSRFGKLNPPPSFSMLPASVASVCLRRCRWSLWTLAPQVSSCPRTFRASRPTVHRQKQQRLGPVRLNKTRDSQGQGEQGQGIEGGGREFGWE